MTTPPTPTSPTQRLVDLARDVAELETILRRLDEGLETGPPSQAGNFARIAQCFYRRWKTRRRPERGG